MINCDDLNAIMQLTWPLYCLIRHGHSYYGEDNAGGLSFKSPQIR